MKTDVGILVALPQELKSLTDIKIDIGECKNLSKSIRICVTGIGVHSVRPACKSLIDSGARVLVSWGTAASLEEGIDTGTLLLPNQIYTENQPVLHTSKKVTDYLKKLLPKSIDYIEKPIFTSSHIIKTKDQKIDLGKKTEAVAVDMESWEIANIAKKNGVDMFAIRAVSDSADMIIPSIVTENISENSPRFLGRLLMHLVKTPDEIIPLLKLYHGFKKANRTLSEAAEYFIPALTNYKP